MNWKKFLTDFIFEWKKTIINKIDINDVKITQFINEYWASKQRQSCSLHEVSYRACFKPELPKFFINLLTKEWDVVYDPFSWRWTTVLEAWLIWRNIIVNDINPLTKILIQPRFFIPNNKDVENRLKEIQILDKIESDIDLTMFYESNTLKEILSLKKYLDDKIKEKKEDSIDRWIRMVATSRLTWHSKWFFSVYTLPPNQAVTKERQIKINKDRNQIPEYRNVKDLILKKSKSLIKDLNKKDIQNLNQVWDKWLFLNNNAWDTLKIKDNSVNLTVTSPPFLDVVNYAQDNWLRCWFNWIDVKEIEKKIITNKKIEDWCEFIQKVFNELYRITKTNWYVAFEVWEVRNWKIKLDEYVVKLWLKSWFKCEWILINDQIFTKTANIWGVNNNNLWTNTNRIVIFKKV